MTPTPAQQREKILRDALESIRDTDCSAGYCFRTAKDALAAADAIPDAPVSQFCARCGDARGNHKIGSEGPGTCLMFLEGHVASRAELIELMCRAWIPGGRLNWAMGIVLDALVKAGAVRLG